MGTNIARPPGHGDYFGANVAGDCSGADRGGQIQVPRRVRCAPVPRHPYKGPLYYSLHIVGTLPAELHAALKTHLREHHGDLALFAPHGLATNPTSGISP